MKMSINEHQLRFSIKEIKNTAPAMVVVLTNKLEHFNSERFISLS